MNGSKVYDKDGNLLVSIPKNEYWNSSDEASTQFESTSAYVTNGDGHLIDSNNNVIDAAYIAGYINPQNKARNILLRNIDKVDFNVDILLTPVSRVRKTYKLNENGEKELVKTEDLTVSSSDIEHLDDYELSMNHTAMVDGLNKCPYHSGLDFTLKMLIVTEKNTNKTIDTRDTDVEDTDEELVNPQTSDNILKNIITLGLSTITLAGITFVMKKY